MSADLWTVYTQLNAVDAPELSAVNFVKTDDLKHGAGCAELCEELLKDGMECQDLYGRPIKEFWFRFTAPPTEKEVRFIFTLKALLPAKSEARK